MNSFSRTKIGIVLLTVLVGVLTGCVAHVDGPNPHARVHAHPPAHVTANVVLYDDYVYYPAHQVYYNSSQRHYVYQERNTWVTRPAPPRVSVDVLLASPSVRLDFRDSPSRHHSTVVRQYPRHWSPPGHNSNSGKGNQGKGNDRR